MQGRSGDVGCIQLKKHFEVTVKLAFVMFSSYTLIICIIDITVTPNCRVSVAPRPSYLQSKMDRWI